MRRLGPLRATCFALAIAGALGALGAHAEASAAAPAATTPPAAQPASPASPRVAGFMALVTGGYGASTTSVRGMGLAPYGATFGLDAGFTFRPGLHLGAFATYSLGKTTNEHRDPVFSRAFDFKADTSAVSGGLNVGWDVPLHFLVLRYSVGFGFTSMKWDFGGVDPYDVRYGDAKNPSLGFQFAPGASLLFPHGRFVCGLGFDYLVQANGTIPSAFIGKALVGVKL